MQLNGSQIIIECLKEQGVDTVFGYPGGTILNVYDELYRHPEIRHVLSRERLMRRTDTPGLPGKWASAWLPAVREPPIW